MCMKKVFNYKLLDGQTVETVSRDCASQKYTEQVSTYYEKSFDTGQV